MNVVEIDLTRSSRRLYDHPLTFDHSYHIAVFIPGAAVRIIPQDFDRPLSRLALPLRSEVIPVDLQSAYNSAYHQVLITPQINRNRHYDSGYIPLPSLLTDSQRQKAVAAVETWQNELNRLKSAL